jgi:hypothetical protein
MVGPVGPGVVGIAKGVEVDGVAAGKRDADTVVGVICDGVSPDDVVAGGNKIYA